MISLSDQLNRKIELDSPAKRIVSLVPSQTELLHYFGLEQEVVGITKFCIHPDDWFQSKTRVGGTKNLKLDVIDELKPDLIIANKEENTQSDIEQLASKYPVYISDVNTIPDAYQMIRDLGILAGKEQSAVDLIDDIQEDQMAIKPMSGTVLYFIWREPYMVCGTSNYINSVIEKLGLKNLIEEPRYVEISKEQIKALDPDYIFLSSEPFPFKEEHVQELRSITSAEIKLVDGEIFSWYGSWMLKMSAYFGSLA